MSILMSVNRFAFNVGACDRLTREATKPYRDAYRTATPEQRVQLERDWVTGYLEGNLKVTPKQAQAIYNTSRTERSDEEQKSYCFELKPRVWVTKFSSRYQKPFVLIVPEVNL